MSLLVLSEDELLGLLPPLEIVGAVEEALRAQRHGIASMPQRLHVDDGDKTLLVMPATTDGHFGVKLVSVVPGNASRSLPVTNGVMVLLDGETGMPVAALNAAALTAQRTGAVGGLGVKYSTPPSTSSVGIVGCGVQGAWQAIFACALRPIRNVYCTSRSASSTERFAATVLRYAPDVKVTRCDDVRELLRLTDLVITATNSSQPVLPDDSALLDRKHFISVGSYRPTMQELPDSVYRLAGELAVDSPHAMQEVGDVINPLQRGLLTQANVFSIADCVCGQRQFRTEATTVYKSVGAAIYDLYVARQLYFAAKSRGLGQEVRL